MLLFMDGFDHYGPTAARLLDGVYAEIAGVALSTANPRTGARNLRISPYLNDAGVRRVLPGDRDAIGMGYAFWINELPANNNTFGLAQWRTSANQNKATLTVTSTGQLQFRGGGRTGEILATSAPVVLAGAYQHFEAFATFTADETSVSSIEVRLNGVTVLNASGLTVNSVEGLPAQIKVGVNGFPLLGAPFTWDVDDFYVWDDTGSFNNAFVGDKKVYTRFPDADGAEQEWTPSIGSDGYAMIDNVPALDSTEYLTAENGLTGTVRSTFGVADFPAEIVSIAAVQTATRLWKTDAGDAKVLVGVISGGNEGQGPEHALSMAPVWYGDVFETDPNTSSVWGLAALNAAQTAIERVE